MKTCLLLISKIPTCIFLKFAESITKCSFGDNMVTLCPSSVVNNLLVNALEVKILAHTFWHSTEMFVLVISRSSLFENGPWWIKKLGQKVKSKPCKPLKGHNFCSFLLKPIYYVCLDIFQVKFESCQVKNKVTSSIQRTGIVTTLKATHFKTTFP